MKASEDRRPEPKPRKHANLWQAYLWWDELVEMNKRHTLRISSAERGKSKMDAQFEHDIIDQMQLEEMMKLSKKTMVNYGSMCGLVWDWLVSIRGIGPPSAAKLIAMFDDVGKFNTVSKFWRFSGWGRYPYWFDAKGNCKGPKDGYQWRTAEDGEREQYHVVLEPKEGWELREINDRGVKGWTLPYFKKLKAACYLVGREFVLHQTPLYVELIDEEKRRLRIREPNVICNRCGCKFTPDNKSCPECGRNNKKHGLKYSAAHIDMMARRKVVKIFLQHLWLVWREAEGLETTEPYVKAHLNHADIIPPPNWPLE